MATKRVEKASITVRESKWKDKGSWDGTGVELLVVIPGLWFVKVVAVLVVSEMI